MPELHLFDLEEALETIGGCGDGNCIVHVRPGMHTNGGCHCNRDPLKMSRVISALRREIERLEAVCDYDLSDWQ